MSQRSAEGVLIVLTRGVDTSRLIFQGEKACHMTVQREKCSAKNSPDYNVSLINHDLIMSVFCDV